MKMKSHEQNNQINRVNTKLWHINSKWLHKTNWCKSRIDSGKNKIDDQILNITVLEYCCYPWLPMAVMEDSGLPKPLLLP